MNSLAGKKPPRFARWLIIGLALLASVIGIVAFLAIDPYGRSEKIRRIECTNNLERIGMALHLYEEVHKTLPPAYVLGPDGEKWHSWRVLLLPFLGEQKLYDEYRMDEPWNGPHNQQLIQRMPAVFGCPSGVGNSSQGRTTYLAVVGAETAWPEQIAMSFADVSDGLSNTIAVVESANSDVAWTEPRDVDYRDAKKGIDGPGRPNVSSRHRTASALTCDGAVRQMRKDSDPNIFRSMLTAHGGRPHPGLPASFRNGRNVASNDRRQELKETVVTPVLDVPLEKYISTVYCATFQMAWDELRDSVIKSPVQLKDPPKMATTLNAERFDHENVSPEAYFVVVGSGREDFQKKRDAASAEKSSGSEPTIDDSANAEAIRIFVRLQKKLSFKDPFEALDAPLTFHANHCKSNVTAFGIKPSQSTDAFDSFIRRQVYVDDHVSDEDFIISLASTSDKITLAKITPEATLAETVNRVLDRKKRPRGNRPRHTFDGRDELAVPFLFLNVDLQFQPLIGKVLLSPGFEGLTIVEARQSILFRLDEKGAALESDAEIVIAIDDDGDENKPRRFIVDKAFLILLQERDAARPYFAAWLTNAELCVPFAKAESDAATN